MSLQFSASGSPCPEHTKEGYSLSPLSSPGAQGSRPSTLRAASASSSADATLLNHPATGVDANEEEGRNDATELLAPKRNINTRLKPRRRRWVKEWWFWEIGGCFLSVACMVTTLILLRFDEKPRNQWKLGISPNTLVSTLTTIAKTAMLLPVAECLTQLKWRHFSLQSHPLAEVESFDAASRGPWGAVVFPWKTKLKSRIALMGALIVAGSLTMEPLGQVAVSYKSELVFSRNEVKIANRSGIFVAQAYNTGDEGLFNAADPFIAPPNMQSAFFEGIFDMGRELPLNCVNGNCTWPEFITLGVCSSCQDVTSSYQPTEEPCTGPDDSGACVHHDYENIQELYGEPFRITTRNETRNTLVKGISSSQFNDTRLITSFILGRFEQYYNNSDNNRNGLFDFVNSTTQLTQCDISWCAQLYHNFTYQNSTANSGKKPYNYTRYNLPLAPVEVNPQSVTSVFKVDIDKSNEFHPDLGLTEQNVTKVYNNTFWENDEGQIFEVNKYDHVTITAFLEDVLNFELVNEEYRRQNRFDRFLGRAFQETISVSRAFDNVALSMSIEAWQTQDARMGNFGFFVDAQTVVAETYIIIQKRWLTVPCLLVLLSVVFLATTLLVNLRDDTPSWKSETLPLLFHGLEGWEEFDREEMGEMQGRSREMQVRLARNERGVLKFLKS